MNDPNVKEETEVITAPDAVPRIGADSTDADLGDATQHTDKGADGGATKPADKGVANDTAAALNGWVQLGWMLAIFCVGYLSCFVLTLFDDPTFLFKPSPQSDEANALGKWILEKIDKSPIPNTIMGYLLVAIFAFGTVSFLSLCSQWGRLDPSLSNPVLGQALLEAGVPWMAISLICFLVCKRAGGTAPAPVVFAVCIQVLAASYFACCLIAGWLVPILSSLGHFLSSTLSKAGGQILIYCIVQALVLPNVLSKALVILNSFDGRKRRNIALALLLIPFLAYFYYSSPERFYSSRPGS